MIVDDDAAMREMLVSLLEPEGFVAETSGSAAEALEWVRERDFDVVLSDVRMPGGSGLELVGEVREARPDTPIVLMTAFGSLDSGRGRDAAGAFDYITKPFKRDAVLVALERASEHRSLRQENVRLAVRSIVRPRSVS